MYHMYGSVGTEGDGVNCSITIHVCGYMYANVVVGLAANNTCTLLSCFVHIFPTIRR